METAVGIDTYGYVWKPIENIRTVVKYGERGGQYSSSIRNQV